MQEKLQQLRKARSEGDRGFTLIELLVVVVIIGILIAIAIPLYLNYENGAKNKSSASDLRGAISTLEQCYTDNSAYPTALAATTGGYSTTGCTGQTINTSSGTTLTYFVSGSNYIIAARQTGQTIWYCYANAAGGSVKTEPGTATYPTAFGACP